MSNGKASYVLFHAQGCGSVFPQTILRLLDIPHELVVCDYEETTHKKGLNYTRLVEANPLAQFPTMITPEGYVMTEMTAIVLYLQDRYAKNTPWDIRALSHSQLAAFYRWFIFIPANMYPVLTVGEFPSRFVRVPADAGIDPKTVESWITKGAFARREELWKMMEQEMTRDYQEGKFLLGTERPTFLDVFVVLVAHYTPHPRFSWFEENCPRLAKCVRATLQTSIVKDVFRDFDKHLFNLRQNTKEPVFVFEPPPGGDVSLRSADGTVFCAHSVILGLVSSVFSDMFSIGRSTREVIQLDDDSESISLLLAFAYPSSVTPTIDKIGILEKCLKVAQKYDVEKITRTLDRDLSLSEAKTGLIRHNPLLIFRLAVTYGLRECQTLAARAITPRHVDFLQPAEIVKAAQEHPTAAHVIGLIGVQTLRAKILSDCLFTFKGSMIPRTWVVAKPGQTSKFTDNEGGELMICDGCALVFFQKRPLHFAPSWIHEWARLAYTELIDKSLDECNHLFSVDILCTYMDSSIDACQDCVQAAINARHYCDGRRGDVFEGWASGVCAHLRDELAVLDCLYSL